MEEIGEFEDYLQYNHYVRNKAAKPFRVLRLGGVCIPSQALRPSDAPREKARDGAVWPFSLKPQRKIDDIMPN